MSSTKLIKASYLLAGLLLTNAAIYAQTGPGGVDATGASTNLKLWLSADHGTYINAGTTLAATDNQSIQQWNDYSGNGTNATNTGSSKPTYNTSALLNGHPVLNFVSQTMTAGFNPNPGTNPNITVMAVAAHNTASSSPNSKLWGHDDGGFDRGVGFDTRATVPFTFFAAAPTGDVKNFATPTANQYFIATSNYTSSTFSGWFNGSTSVSGAGVNNGSGLTSLSIGSLAPTVEYWNGKIAEFIVFNKTLNDAERIIAENYLASKYGLTLAANDVYDMDKPSNGNYDFEVAGIGQSAVGSNVTTARGTGIVTISNANNLGTGEYFMFGHDNGLLTAMSAGAPTGYTRMRRTWRVSEAGGDVGTMNVSFDLSGLSNVPASASDIYLLIDANNDGSFADETTVGGGIIASPTQNGSAFTFSGVNIADAQRFTLAYTNLVPLPVKLSSFAAAPQGNANLLHWETASESNLTAFEIERSADGNAYVKMGTVQPHNTSTGNGYQFRDEQPLPVNYYRLKMLENAGRYSYSSVVKVATETLQTGSFVSPNPVSDKAVIGFPAGDAMIKLYDLTGRILWQQKVNGSAYELSMKAYAAGVYFIGIDVGGQRYRHQVIKN